MDIKMDIDQWYRRLVYEYDTNKSCDCDKIAFTLDEIYDLINAIECS